MRHRTDRKTDRGICAVLAVNFRATKYRVEARSATKEVGEKTAPKRQQLVVQDKDILPPVEEKGTGEFIFYDHRRF